MPIANTNQYVSIGDGLIRITTRLGDEFLIDAADETIAKRHCWSRHEHGYARAVCRDASGKMRTVYLHRLICATTLELPHVDHKNGNTSDCRRINLRPCSRSQNLSNQKIRSDNRTGVKGVGIHKQTGKYLARITASGRKMHLGLFSSLDEAQSALALIRDKIHGEFARHV
jgi:hypothetical protein